MLGTSKRIATLLVLGGAVLSAPALAVETASVAPEVQAAIPDDCKEKVTLHDGFVQQENINNDGKPDYILRYDFFQCGEVDRAYCGSGGCMTKIFVSAPDGHYRKVFEEQVQDFAVKRLKGKFAFVRGEPRCFSGKCQSTYAWNGRIFVPLRHRP